MPIDNMTFLLDEIVFGNVNVRVLRATQESDYEGNAVA